MTRSSLFLFLLIVTAGVPLRAAEQPPIAVIPSSVQGVQTCCISLNGTWEFAMAPGASFWSANDRATVWQSIIVPGECQMQGFMIEHDREYAYRKAVHIPADLAGKQIAIRFNGVYSFARVWVNGQYLRSHHGGFTTWECDLTPCVTPGAQATVIVGITDRADDISYASGYAHHPIGGILRHVELVIRPATHIVRMNVQTSFLAGKTDAVLQVTTALSHPRTARIAYTLTDPVGKHVSLQRSTMDFTQKNGAGVMTFPVRSPRRWDAEHPFLYTLEGRLIVDGRTEETVTQRFGFREVVVEGTRLLVNGRPVKLRGACRHDIHPTLGRSTSPEQDLQDVLLAKEANFNFIRTSHYPPSADFLQYCDEYGIYVEDESAVCFVNTHRSGAYQAMGGSQNDTAFTDRYLTQLTDMVGHDRNHPSVLLWSLGNESTYGTNFQRSFDTVRALDRTRPIIFSYAHTVPDSVHCYDLLSDHYPSWDRCLKPSKADSTRSIPVVGDEWMHVPCYCLQDLRDDPGIRDAWGESMKRAWENNVSSPFSIGGAIWGMIDEVFPLPDTTVGYGQWGIVDIWRRKKPEFWHTRKAYSPVHVQLPEPGTLAPGKDIALRVYNRFDHTDLHELTITCESGGAAIVLPSPSVAPHESGSIIVPGTVDRHGPIRLRFIDAWQRCVDEEVLAPPAHRTPVNTPSKGLKVDHAGPSIVVHGGEFEVTFDRATGLITSASAGGEKIVAAGPYLRIVKRGPPLSWDVDTTYDIGGTSWRADTVALAMSPSQVVVASRGHTDSLKASLRITVTAAGEIITAYEIMDPPATCQEAGVHFLLTPAADHVRWNRAGIWSSYPDDHIGRPEGEAAKYAFNRMSDSPHRRPEHAWGMDTKDDFLFPGQHGRQPSGLPVPADFRSRKENIFSYALTDQRTGNGISATSDGTIAARTAVRADGMLDLFLDNEWTYLNMNWGNYERPANLKSPYAGSITVHLTHLP